MSSGPLQNAHSKGKTWHTMDHLHFKNATKENAQIIIIIRAARLLLSMRQCMCMHGYLYGCLHLSVCSHVCEHVRRGGWVAEVRRLSFCEESWTSASPSCLEQALQHALIARKMRESKNWNLAVIAMRKKKISFDCFYIWSILDHTARIPHMVNRQTGNYEESNLSWLVGCVWWDPLWTRLSF